MTIYRSGAQRTKVANPWRLSLCEVDVMDAIVADDDELDAIAAKLKVAPATLRSHTSSVRKRMGVNTTVRAAVLWDRWRQTDGKDVPA